MYNCFYFFADALYFWNNNIDFLLAGVRGRYLRELSLYLVIYSGIQFIEVFLRYFFALFQLFTVSHLFPLFCLLNLFGWLHFFPIFAIFVNLINFSPDLFDLRMQ